jgi:hypothetical protein
MRAPLSARGWTAPLVALALALGAARPASADGAGQDPSAEADELFQKAGQAYDAGDFALARTLYGQAFERKKTHDIAAMMAQTELKLGRPCEADAHLAWAVANFPPSLPEDRRAPVLRARAEVKAKIGFLRISTTPVDASVQIDHRPVPEGALPGPLCAAAGKRAVFASRDGYAVERRTVTVEPGATATITVDLRRVAPAEEPPPAAPSSPRLAPSRPPAPASPLTPMAFSGLFMGIGAMAVSATLLPLAWQKKSEADDLSRNIGSCPWRGAAVHDPTEVKGACLHLWSLQDQEAGLANAGMTALLLGAGVAAAAGGFLLLRPSTSGARPGGPRITVGAAQDGAFVALTGDF